MRCLPVVAGVETLGTVLADTLVVTAVVPLLSLTVALALVHAHVWGHNAQHAKQLANLRPSYCVNEKTAQIVLPSSIA